MKITKFLSWITKPWWARMLLLFIIGTSIPMTIGTTVTILLHHGVTIENPQAYTMDHPWPGLAIGMLAEGIFGYWLYRRFVRKHENRQPTELTPSKLAFRELTIGALIGTAFMGLVMVVLWLLGCYHPTSIGWSNGLLVGLATGIGAAFLEESVFRGFLLRYTDKKWGKLHAITITAVVFGLAHILNSLSTGEFSIIGPIAIIVETLPLVAAYYITRRLWLSIGIHAAWNTMVSGVFSQTVSGSDSVGGIINGTMNGPELLTGGSFGPEASIVTVVIGGMLSVIMFALVQKKEARTKVQSSKNKIA